MRSRLGTFSLFPPVILWGILLGGIVYSHLIFFPVYLSNLPDSAVVVNGPYGLHEASFWLTVHPLLIISLLAALALNWKHKTRRKLILLSLGIYVIVLVVTRMFFVPELMAFEQSAQSNLSPAEWRLRGIRWQRFSWIRGTVLFFAILPLLFSLTRTDEPSASNRISES